MSRHVLSLLVEDKPGLLTRVAGLFARRGFNIESLAVGVTEVPGLSRITVVVDVEGLPLEQVTLGGEPVDQAILDRLREVYPDARISWIYASSEAGAAIAVISVATSFLIGWHWMSDLVGGLIAGGLFLRLLVEGDAWFRRRSDEAALTTMRTSS